MKKETNEKESEVKAAQIKHLLMEFSPIIFNSFEEWLARWNGTNYLAEKLGLLHSLTTRNNWWLEPELVSLLLSVADGCADESFNDNRGYKLYYGRQVEAENRKSIAKKAFSVLCLKFFQSGRNEEPSWWWMLEHEVLFQKVLWFLRQRSDGLNRLYNHSCICDSKNDHQQEIFRNFLRKLSRLGWDFRCPESRRRWDEKTRDLVKKRLVTARPQFIDVLCELGELSWLNGKDRELDAESIKKLTEMALSSALFLPPEKISDSFSSLRKPKDLEEAVLGGSVAARIVLLHQIKEDKRRHISALYEATVKQRDEQQRKAELADIEKEKTKLNVRARSLTES